MSFLSFSLSSFFLVCRFERFSLYYVSSLSVRSASESLIRYPKSVMCIYQFVISYSTYEKYTEYIHWIFICQLGTKWYLLSRRELSNVGRGQVNLVSIVTWTMDSFRQ